MIEELANHELLMAESLRWSEESLAKAWHALVARNYHVAQAQIEHIQVSSSVAFHRMQELRDFVTANSLEDK